MIGIVGTWTVGFFFTFLFECGTDYWALWSTLNDLLTHCVNDILFQKVMSVSDVVTDALILALPLPVVCSASAQLSDSMAVLTSLSDLAATTVSFSKDCPKRCVLDGCVVSATFDLLICISG